ncbi:MAG: class I SAM-dependent methyltransferase [Deinococcota bacterium]|nr:class I SAM-dependent methyltransferase [Deinococcota bacterium]
MKQQRHDRLRTFQDLLRRYHRTLDLLSPTGLADLPQLVEEALLYPQVLARPIKEGTRWLDLGSGAGLPALPLAIVRPDLSFTLVERRRRRAAFLNLVRAQLALDNVSVVADDVGSYRPTASYPVISAQAVGNFSLVYALTRHLQADRVSLVSRKGPDWRSEVGDLERMVRQRALESRELVLPRHGRLASVTISGGLPCPPLA